MTAYGQKKVVGPSRSQIGRLFFLGLHIGAHFIAQKCGNGVWESVIQEYTET